MFLIGVMMAPFGQLWYFKLMERLIPGAPSIEIALKKVLADQIVAGPVFISFFFSGNYKLQNRIVHLFVHLSVSHLPYYKCKSLIFCYLYQFISINVLFFILGIGLLEGRGGDFSIAELKNKFLTVYMVRYATPFKFLC